ncbi:hypothetical protein F4809DRAFT_644260 [Biscogniauxia mediterranea]|nr:hypothetical protein F4809DRAFT_644260 [Biscogniauxia mediterranea]
MATYGYSQNSYFGHSQGTSQGSGYRLEASSSSSAPSTPSSAHETYGHTSSNNSTGDASLDSQPPAAPTHQEQSDGHSSPNYVLVQPRGLSKHAMIKDGRAFMRTFMEEERRHNAERHESETADDRRYQPESSTHGSGSGSASSAGPAQTPPPSTSQSGSTGRFVHDEKYVVVVKLKEYLEYLAQCYLEGIDDEEYAHHEEGYVRELIRDLLGCYDPEDSEGAEDYDDDDQVVFGEDMDFEWDDDYDNGNYEGYDSVLLL